MPALTQLDPFLEKLVVLVVANMPSTEAGRQALDILHKKQSLLRKQQSLFSMWRECIRKEYPTLLWMQEAAREHSPLIRSKTLTFSTDYEGIDWEHKVREVFGEDMLSAITSSAGLIGASHNAIYHVHPDEAMEKARQLIAFHASQWPDSKASVWMEAHREHFVISENQEKVLDYPLITIRTKKWYGVKASIVSECQKNAHDYPVIAQLASLFPQIRIEGNTITVQGSDVLTRMVASTLMSGGSLESVMNSHDEPQIIFSTQDKMQERFQGIATKPVEAKKAKL